MNPRLRHEAEGEPVSFLSGVLESFLGGVHGVLEPLVGAAAWGWSIVLLTVSIRFLMSPLAVRQFRNARAMRELQPRINQIKERHDTSRQLRRDDPERYRKHKDRMNQEIMSLYSEEGVNPASGCLPLLIQAPVFIALFRLLRSSPVLKEANFYILTTALPPTASHHGLGATVTEAGVVGWALIAVLVVASFLSQRQLAATRSASDDEPSVQQRTMAVAMPALFGVMARGLPLGVMLYWLTTTAWQWIQQHLLLRRAAVAQA